MLRAKNILLLKAVAIGALFINGNMGIEEEDKPEKVSRKFACSVKIAEGSPQGGEQDRDGASYIRKILEGVEGRKAIRRDLLRQLHTIDLSVKPIGYIFDLLHNAKKYSDKETVKVKLNLLNVTQAQLDRIRQNENAAYIDKIDWTYHPMMQGRGDKGGSISAIANILKEVDERTKARRDLLRQPRTIDLSIKPVEYIFDLLHNAKKYSDKETLKVKLNLLNVTQEQLDRIRQNENAAYIDKIDWTYHPMMQGRGDKGGSISAIANLLKEVDERTKARRDLLRQPRIIDLSVKPVEYVLELLDNAHKYSGKDPVRFPLRLLNATEEQLRTIAHYKYAGHIKKLRWTYHPMMQSVNRANFGSILRQIIVQKGQLLKGTNPPLLLQQAEGEEDNDQFLFQEPILDQMDFPVLEQGHPNAIGLHDEQDRDRARFTFVLQQIIGRKDEPLKGLNPILPLKQAERGGGDANLPLENPILDPMDVHMLEQGHPNAIGLHDEQDRDRARFTFVLQQIIGRKDEPLKGLNPILPLKQVERGGGDANLLENPILDPMDVPMLEQNLGRQPDIIGLNAENADHVEEVEQINLMDEEEAQAEPAEENNVGHVEEFVKVDQPILGAIVPNMYEVNEKMDEDQAETEFGMEGKVQLTPIKIQDNNMDPMALSWKITPVKEDISNTILQTLGSPNTQARQASQNLVNIYCRHVPGMIRSQ